MGNSSSKSKSPAPSFRYVDPFLGKTLCIPADQRAQIDAPLHVIAAAALRLHLPLRYPLAQKQPPSPSGYKRVSLWPAQLQRSAIGFAAAACNGLATATAGVELSARTTLHLRTRILLCIIGGHISRINVHARLPAVIAAAR